MKFVAAFGLMAAYAVVLLALYTLHAWYFPVDVVLFSATIDAGLAALLCLAVLGLVKRIRRLFCLVNLADISTIIVRIPWSWDRTVVTTFQRVTPFVEALMMRMGNR